MVKVLDPETNTITEIPKSELAPGLIKIRQEGVGLVWMDSAKAAGFLKQGEYRHPPFDEDIRDLLREIKDAFDGYYTKSLEDWEDGLRRERNSEQEIALWLYGADLMKAFTEGGPTPRNREVFCLVMQAMTNGPQGALLTFEREHLTEKEVKDILAPR